VQAPDQANTYPVCTFCGDRHPREQSCRDWARLSAEARGEDGSASALAPLPARLDIPFELPSAKPLIDPRVGTALRAIVACFALFGAIELGWIVVGHFAGSHQATTTALPGCTPDRIRQNLVSAATIQSEADFPAAQRIDATIQLVLGSSTDCSDQLFSLYAAAISYQTLCLRQTNSTACGQLTNTRTQLAQALNDSQ
jgi:hypothetical protein